MKNLILSLFIIISFFFTSCQNDSIVDPVTNNDMDKSIAYYLNIGSNSIKLDAQLLDPRHGFTEPLSIQGKIDYGVSFLGFNQTQSDANYNTIVKLKIDAVLIPSIPTETNSCRTIYKETVDNIKINRLGSREYSLTKRYEITGCANSMVLECNYAVTTNRVTLKSMRLVCCNQYVIQDPTTE
ncbi:MAG: hypothetical protein IH620_02425 [Ignavibacterium sp.]|nr:hypothetical protein [Ignavibacterium sp.]